MCPRISGVVVEARLVTNPPNSASFGELLVFVATLALAIVTAFSVWTNARDQKKALALARTPIFTVEKSFFAFDDMGCVNHFDVELKNTGYGPALNVTLECWHGSNRLPDGPWRVRETDEFIQSPSRVLSVGQTAVYNSRWDRRLVRPENAGKSFRAVARCLTMFGRGVVQEFDWEFTNTGKELEALDPPTCTLLDLGFGRVLGSGLNTSGVAGFIRRNWPTIDIVALLAVITGLVLWGVRHT
jgi:hypothetical protein